MKWSTEQKEYLKQITPGRHYKEILELMNEKFDFDLTMDQVKAAIARYKLNTGFTGRFEKGSIPPNKGVKGVIYEGCKKSWFKKGQTPLNHRPVGSERVNVDGYTEIKVAEPNKWRLKHNVIWEKYNGALPKRYAIIFGDGDKSNFDIENLIIVSRRQLLTLNKNKLIQNNADLTRTALIIADIHHKISDLKKLSNSKKETLPD